MKAGLIVNQHKKGADQMVAELASLMLTRGEELYTFEKKRVTKGLAFIPEEQFFSELDLIISLGGDGSILHAVQLMGKQIVPILGINLGRLGFLTSAPQERTEEVIDLLLTGQYNISERTRIEVTLHLKKKEQKTFIALNDVAIGWGTSSRISRLSMSINGDYVTDYTCDGLIVSTPTGSTGHSLSAGGPILHPDADVFVISPICPHTLTSRPLVIPNNSEISVVIGSSSQQLLLAVDGQKHCPLEEGMRITFSKSRYNAKFIHFPGHSYFDILRKKLDWGGSSNFLLL